MFLGQSFQTLEHEQDRQTHGQTDRHTQTNTRIDVTECIITKTFARGSSLIDIFL